VTGMTDDPKPQPDHAETPDPALPRNVNDPQDDPAPAAVPDNHQPHREPFDL